MDAYLVQGRERSSVDIVVGVERYHSQSLASIIVSKLPR